MKIAFFGTPRLAQIALSHLIDSRFEPAFAVTRPDKKTGRGQKISNSPVKQTAAENHIEVFESLENLPGFDLGILVAFGKILSKNILDIPKYGFLNLHPSLLPKYRGPSPIQTAILNGESETGATIIKLDEQIDHGPILAQKSMPIEKDDTHMTIIEKLGLIGSNLLLEILPDYTEGKLKPKAQDDNNATFTKHISKQDGFIDTDSPPDPQTLDRMIRAYFPWPTVWTKIDGKIIKLLPNGMVQPESKKPMTVKEFQNGYPQVFEKIKTLTQ